MKRGREVSAAKIRKYRVYIYTDVYLISINTELINIVPVEMEVLKITHVTFRK
jgi:hypothetical protein